MQRVLTLGAKLLGRLLGLVTSRLMSTLGCKWANGGHGWERGAGAASAAGRSESACSSSNPD